MKKTTTLALLAVLSLATAGCQKEDLRNSATRETTEQAYAENCIVYSIDGQTYTASFRTPEEKEAFFLQLMAIARQGHVVNILSTQTTQSLAKEKVTYETDKPEDAAKWCMKMENLGYEVTVTFDEATGIYTCTAIK